MWACPAGVGVSSAPEKLYDDVSFDQSILGFMAQSCLSEN
jgi:hypothetical protein